MKNSVLKYGLISGAVMLGMFGVAMFFSEATTVSLTTQEVIGYTSMILATSIVYFGIKHYRDNEGNGSITLGRGLAVGMLIVLFPSLLFGAADVFYITVINPEWVETYYANYVADMKQNMPAEEFEVALVKMEAEKEMFANPMISFIVMSVTVLMVGFITTIISALILKKA